MFDDPPKNLPSGNSGIFHYTSYFGLEGILRSKSLWCSKMQYLNDTEELRHGLNLMAEVADAEYSGLRNFSKLRDSCDRISDVNIFICSFCEQRDLLSQWRGYAGGNGVAIGFSFDAIRNQASKNGYRLEKCVYTDESKLNIVRSFLDDYATSPDDVDDLDAHGFDIAISFARLAATVFKNSSFAEEKEWRLVSPMTPYRKGKIRTRAYSNGLIPYTNFDLTTGTFPIGSDKGEYICIDSVDIGPHRYQELQMNAFGGLAEEHDVCVIYTGRSSIPYRQF